MLSVNVGRFSFSYSFLNILHLTKLIKQVLSKQRYPMLTINYPNLTRKIFKY